MNCSGSDLVIDPSRSEVISISHIEAWHINVVIYLSEMSKVVKTAVLNPTPSYCDSLLKSIKNCDRNLTGRSPESLQLMLLIK